LMQAHFAQYHSLYAVRKTPGTTKRHTVPSQRLFRPQRQAVRRAACAQTWSADRSTNSAAAPVGSEWSRVGGSAAKPQARAGCSSTENDPSQSSRWSPPSKRHSRRVPGPPLSSPQVEAPVFLPSCRHWRLRQAHAWPSLRWPSKRTPPHCAGETPVRTRPHGASRAPALTR
jgi:hypothetical protein